MAVYLSKMAATMVGSRPDVIHSLPGVNLSISSFRGVWCTFSFLFYFELKFLCANSVDTDQMALFWVCTVCLCPFYGMLRHKWVNPHLPSGPIHPYQLDESISSFRDVWCTFSLLFYFEDILVSKQWRPWSDAVLCTSDMGLHCLPMSHKWVTRLVWVNVTEILQKRT